MIPGHLLQKAVAVLVTAQPSRGWVLGQWRALGLYRKSYLCFLPLQFDKFSPKLDSPYFRHSNVSPCALAQITACWGCEEATDLSTLPSGCWGRGKAVLKGPPPCGAHSPEHSLSLEALPALPSHGPWAAHPACTPWPLSVPSGHF